MLPGVHPKISSVRGDLFKNYSYTYGFLGRLLAFVHYVCLIRFDLVLALNKTMRQQLREVSNCYVIPNFWMRLLIDQKIELIQSMMERE